MSTAFTVQTIARIHSEFPEKFGIPRQSGLADTHALVIFEPAYRDPEALRGIEDFSHLWLIWVFDQAIRETWSPTVRPPRLGGNARMGVFATRSPFRPNPIALSSVQLERVEYTAAYGPVLHVRGADLMDGTPILDIKPYLPYTDSHPEAAAGFAGMQDCRRPEVIIPPACLEQVPPEHRAALQSILEQDPRPRYQNQPDRVYGFGFAGMEIRFSGDEQHLTVLEILPAKQDTSNGSK